MLAIDGSMGEGGGQVTRSSVTLSALTGRDIQINHIREGRSRPGLQPQHLTCVRAAGEVCNADLEGDAEGSRHLTFSPGEIQSDSYDWDIGTAGALTLVLQTVLPILSEADDSSEIKLTGGTHVRNSPTYDYMERVYLPAVKKLGLRCSLHLLRYGFYPKGGGRVRFTIHPGQPPSDHIDWSGKRTYRGVKVISISTKDLKDRRVAQRQVDGVKKVFGSVSIQSETHYVDSLSTGTAVLVYAEGTPPVPGRVSLGKKGKPAENVGEDAADPLLSRLREGTPLDHHLTDQLLLPLALQSKRASLRIPRFSSHLKTQLTLLDAFDLKPEVEKSYLGGQNLVVHFEFPDLRG